MLTFSRDPQVAEQEMHTILYCLTAFGYIDGDFAPEEKAFIRDYTRKLVESRARAAVGGDLAAHADTVARWTEHYHELLDQIDHEILFNFTESVVGGEDSKHYVLSRLKLRCFELLKRFPEEGRAALLATVDELMHADGVVDPAEQRFRDEVAALVAAPIELEEAELVPVEGTLVIDEPRRIAPRERDQPMLRSLEVDYARGGKEFARQAQGDLDLMQEFLTTLDKQRAAGAGRLATARDFTAFTSGEPFLDGHVYVAPPAGGPGDELLVLGDLHGCYSCLKAALLQADFFAKVRAYRQDPTKNPRMMLVLLGDYIDRGRFSYNGILRTVMQLFVRVPDHVFVLRGNHEYYVELDGQVLAPVRPSEAMNDLKPIAPNSLFAAYMRLFEELPSMLVHGRTLFVHGGIPRDDDLVKKLKNLPSLNDPDLRFQMLWSDPSEADLVPRSLQAESARFPFGKRQFKAFMSYVGCSTMIRGHQRIVEGFRKIYDDPDAVLLSLFSAGGETNNDLPESSNYREVTPMALTIRQRDGVTQMTPFAIDYGAYNDPEVNAFFRQRVDSAGS